MNDGRRVTKEGWPKSLWCLGLLLLAPPACVTVKSAATHSDSGIRLPPGEGRAILERACTTCHNLDGIEAFKGYYDKEKWHALVVTMVDHGAMLEEPQILLVTDYLAEHFGPGTR